MASNCRGSLPGLTTSRSCCAATAIRSLSTSMRFRPSCRSPRCSCSTETRPKQQQADLSENLELNGQRRRKRQPLQTLRPATVAAVLCPYRHGEERTREAKLEEAVGLARAIDLDVHLAQTVPLRHQTPATLLGKGVVERVKAAVEADHIGLVIVDDKLTPVQQRNLE